MDRTYEEINSLYQDLQDISRLAVANEQRANRVEIWNAEYQRIKASKPEVLKSIKISDLNICLSGANLSGIDLSEANLSGVNLSNADLSFTSLNMVDLSGAVLNYANITGADLRNAKISGADLSWASLNGADLSGAVLNYANMTGADFRNAKISGARFQDAIMVHCHMNQKTSNDASCKEAFEGTNYLSLDPRYEIFIKRFITAVKKSNPDVEIEDKAGERFNFTQLIGLYVGGEYGLEEFMKNGEITTRLSLLNFKPIDDLPYLKEPQVKLLDGTYQSYSDYSKEHQFNEDEDSYTNLDAEEHFNVIYAGRKESQEDIDLGFGEDNYDFN